MAQELTILLNGSGMTIPHRVGLAGLYLTLRSLDRRGVNVPELEWTLERDRVLLRFTGERPAPAFRELIQQSFGADSEGFYRFPALESKTAPGYDKRHLLYDALRGSFLQFGPHNQSGPNCLRSYEIDDQNIVLDQFAPVIRYRHQDAEKDFLTGRGDFVDGVPIKGWLFPGGAEKHAGLSNTALREPVALALCLLYAPIGAVYYRLESHFRQRKARVAVVFPQIRDLRAYADVRERMGAVQTLEMSACGPADAGMRYLLQSFVEPAVVQGLELSGQEPQGCLVMCFGIVSWNEKQKSRTASLELITMTGPTMSDYQVANAVFKNRWQPVKQTGKKKVGSTAFVKVMATRELIADNCAHGRSWYTGYADAMSKTDLREQLRYEGKELAKMVEQSSLEERDRLFVQACQEAWRRRMGRLGERADKENVKFSALVEREQERIRVSLSRCKNVSSLRETVADLWARAGNIEVLRDGWQQVLPLLSEENWRRARDLAMIALVSYKPQDRAANE